MNGETPMAELPPSQQPGFLQGAEKTVSVPLWVWIAIAAAALVLIAVVAAMLVKRKKSKAKKKPLPPRITNIHGIGKRDSQQDAFAVSSCEKDGLWTKKGVLAVLADGMGGYAHGGKISTITVKTMMEGFAAGRRFGETPREELMGLLRLADRQVAEFMEANAVELGGSTLVAVLIRGDLMDYVSVGDSRLCLVRNGAMQTLNKVHNYGAELDELAAKGAIAKEHAKSHPQRAALTSFIGIKELKKVDGSENSIKLQKGDRLILMSDGVFNTLSDDEILRCMKEDVYASAQCLEQMIAAKNADEQDNFTAILIEQP